MKLTAQQITEAICDYYGIHKGDTLTVSPEFNRHLVEDRHWRYDVWEVGTKLTIKHISPAQYRDEIDHPENPAFEIGPDGSSTMAYFRDILEMKDYEKRKASIT